MPLPSYQQYRASPPPVADVPALSQARRPSNASQWSVESFADSLDAYTVTPLDQSPVRYHSSQKLLPKLRTQESTLGQHAPARSRVAPVPAPAHNFHRRAVSTGYDVSPQRLHPAAAGRSISSPLERSPTPDPNSAFSACFSASSDCTVFDSPVTIVPSVSRTVRSGGHGRSVSSSSVDHSTLLKYCNPGYRAPPSFLSQSYWTEAGEDGASTFIPPAVAPAIVEPISGWDLPEEMQFTQPDDATMTLNDYLRGPNPAFDLCQSVASGAARGMQNHYWWDMRNVEAWSDFNLASILAVPGFAQLLNIPVAQAAFPDPAAELSRSHVCPDSEATLADSIRLFYAAKVNAALKVSMFASHALAMRPCRDRDGPTFVSNYQNDAEKTLTGNGRGRVVGIVRSYNAWNSGMRAGNNIEKVKYLETLALLHRHMREHQTRYGFIMTETELVCARAGSDDKPFFGHLELSAPIETRTHGGGSSGSGSGYPTPPLSDNGWQNNNNSSSPAKPASSSAAAADAAASTAPITAPLALWYLHMLAKEEPLPGQPGWRLSVGAPAAMTRKHVRAAKSPWIHLIPLPNKRETRTAKLVRGWTWPEDPWNKKREGGRIGGRR